MSKSQWGTQCPHCKTMSGVKKSNQITSTYREAIYQCRNIFCGHVFKVAIHVVATLSPSAIPDPSINLPFGKRIKRDAIKAQIENSTVYEEQTEINFGDNQP